MFYPQNIQTEGLLVYILQALTPKLKRTCKKLCLAIPVSLLTTGARFGICPQGLLSKHAYNRKTKLFFYHFNFVGQFNKAATIILPHTTMNMFVLHSKIGAEIIHEHIFDTIMFYFFCIMIMNIENYRF